MMTRRNVLAIAMVMGIMTGLFHLRQAAWAPCKADALALRNPCYAPSLGTDRSHLSGRYSGGFIPGSLGDGSLADLERRSGGDSIESVALGSGSLVSGFQIQDFSGWPLLSSEDPDSPLGGWVDDPVVVDTGEFVLLQRDREWPNYATLVAAERLYRHQTSNQGGGDSDFGSHFNTNLRTFIEDDTNDTPPTPVVHLGNGEALRFPVVGGSYQSPAGWERYTLAKETLLSGKRYVLTYKHGSADVVYTFEENVDPAQLHKRVDRNGNGEYYSYDASGCCTAVLRCVQGVCPPEDIHIERNVDHTISLIYDTDGNSIQYSYDANKNLIKVEDACGSCSSLPTVEYAYDAQNRMTGIKDAYGAVVRTIVYDESNRLSYYEDANHKRYTFEYGSPNLVIDPTGASTEYTYDLDGHVSSKKFKMGEGEEDDILYTYLYDVSGRATSMTAPNGAVVEQRYDSRGNLLSRWVTADSQTIPLYSATYELNYNRPVLEVNSQGQSTTYVYDSNGATVVGATGTSRIFAYNADGQLTSKTVADVETRYTYTDGFLATKIVDYGGLDLTTSYEVNSMGQDVAIVNALGDTNSGTRDGGGNILTETSNGGIGRAYDYDLNGRLNTRTVSNEGTTHYSWAYENDGAGNLISETAPDGAVTSYGYDGNGRKISETQPNGLRTEWAYDQFGQVVEVKKGDGDGTHTVTQTIYDKMGNVLSTIDSEGRVTEHMYDGFGRGTTVVDATGAYAVYEYDGVLCTAVKRFDNSDQILSDSRVEYDVAGRVRLQRRLANPGGSESTDDAVTETEYDAVGQVIRKIVKVDTTTSTSTNYAYDAAGRKIHEIDPDGNTTSYAYDEEGNRTLEIDGNGHQSVHAYDPDGRLTQSTEADGSYTIFGLDDRGYQTKVSWYSSSANLLACRRYEYNAGGHLTLTRRMADPTVENDANDYVVRSYYDDAGILLTRRSASGYNTTYAYDSQGRQTCVTLADGSYSRSRYDDSGRLTQEIRYEILGDNTLSYRVDHVLDALGRRAATINQGPDATFGTGDDMTTEYVYDGLGRRVSTIDEAGRVSVIAYDGLGRKTKVTEDTTGVARLTEFAYDRAGRLITLTAYTDSPSTGPQQTVYAYNGRGLQTMVTYEETGDVSMSYDNVGNLIQRIDGAGITVDYEYDAMNRRTRRLVEGSTDNVERYEYDALGRLVIAEKGSSANPDCVSRSVFAYDNLSRMISESQAISEGTANVVQYTYDKAGNRISLQQDAGQNIVSYAYDSRDRCVDIDQFDAADSEWVQLAEYTWLGSVLSKRETTCDYPGNTKPKFKTEFGRDGLMRVTSVGNVHLTEDMALSAVCQLGSWDYTYDASSNVLSTLCAADMMGKLRDQRIYGYDTLNRLTNAQLKDIQDWATGWPFCQKTTSYSYDELGNRGSHDYREEGVVTYSHDNANRMTTLAGLSQGYDLAGNQTTGYSVDRGTPYVYKYDHHNRLTGIYDGTTGTTRKAAFTYDALGRRIAFVDDVNGNTVRYYYDGGNEILETNEVGNKLRTYVHGISYVDERLMMMDYADTVTSGDERPYYFVIDRMYNVRGLVDRAGALIERYVYDPYGRPLIRECAGRGDMWGPDSVVNNLDVTLFVQARDGSIWDPRADINDDGVVDGNDNAGILALRDTWNVVTAPTVATAFSDVWNPFMFQGRPHFALDTEGDATEAALMLNDHRARFADPVTGRWITKDPLEYVDGANLYEFVGSQPSKKGDPFGLWGWWKVGRFYFHEDERYENPLSSVYEFITDEVSVSINSTEVVATTIAKKTANSCWSAHGRDHGWKEYEYKEGIDIWDGTGRTEWFLGRVPSWFNPELISLGLPYVPAEFIEGVDPNDVVVSYMASFHDKVPRCTCSCWKVYQISQEATVNAHRDWKLHYMSWLGTEERTTLAFRNVDGSYGPPYDLGHRAVKYLKIERFGIPACRGGVCICNLPNSYVYTNPGSWPGPD